MGFGRDVRDAMFHQVTAFSTREVGAFGAPSLITRITNDVQQVQLLVVMACTMAIAAPLTFVFGIIAALHQDVRLSVIVLVSGPLAAIAARVSWSYEWFRRSGSCRSASTGSTESCASRSPVFAWSGPSSASRRKRALCPGQRRPHRHRQARRAAHGDDVSDRQPGRQLVSVAVLWLGAVGSTTGRLQVGALIAYLCYLIQILMAVVMGRSCSR